jgi:hypothetical protein
MTAEFEEGSQHKTGIVTWSTLSTIQYFDFHYEIELLP